MRILWLATVGSYYNGVGWVNSLKELVETTGNELALAFLSDDLKEKQVIGNTTYYPVRCPKNTFFRRLKEHYGGYKKNDGLMYLPELQRIISDFQPDAIHVFGLEIPFSDILGNTDVPVIVHLQGLLVPADNAFFPAGMSEQTFRYPISKNEWILRNGILYDKKKMHARAEREAALWKKVRIVMGRTEWDCQMTQLFAPKAQYYHVDEVLRQVFYENAGKWHRKEGIFTIVSTITPVLYKGFDTILKTAAMLAENTDFKFVWKVVGLDENSYFVKVLEKKLGIRGKNVNIDYQGVKTADELCEILLNADVYVHPSYIDNSSNSVCEAQMLGVPVVATYVGGTPSLIENGKDGFLVPANGVFELAQLLERLHADSVLCENVSRNAVATAIARHDKEKIVDDLMKVYQTVTGLAAK